MYSEETTQKEKNPNEQRLAATLIIIKKDCKIDVQQQGNNLKYGIINAIKHLDSDLLKHPRTVFNL